MKAVVTPVRWRRRESGIVVVCFALLMALFLSTMPVLAAPSGTRSVDHDTITSIELHKFEQPVTAGTAADGLPRDTNGLTPVSGATYTAKLVPGIDLTTNDGQQAAARLSIRDAAERIIDVPDAASAVTDGNGNATLSDLQVGLYYVQETVIPAGYAGAIPFVVALPMTDPTGGDSWLTTVHVYPKSARVGITLDVIDQDAVKIGDTVHWISRSGIPLRSSVTGYRVDQIIDPRLYLFGDPGKGTRHVTVTIGVEDQAPQGMQFATFMGRSTGTLALTADNDYRIAYSVDTRTLTVVFLEPGLRKLEQSAAADPGAQVHIGYDTTVRAEGSLANQAVLYPSLYAVESDTGVRDDAITRWGPLSVTVFHNDDPSAPIPGAVFEVYATPQDAFTRRNPVTINGVHRWTTDERGRLIINGLRFSEFVNGLDREVSDPLFRDYWVVPVGLPDGWTWVDGQPLNGMVTSDLEYQTVVYLAERIRDGHTGGDDDGTPGHPGLLFGFIPIFWDFGGSSDQTSGGVGPGASITPGDPGTDPATPGIQTDEGTGFLTSRGTLASTGAQVIGLVMFGVVLLIAGAFLLVGRRRRNGESVQS